MMLCVLIHRFTKNGLDNENKFAEHISAGNAGWPFQFRFAVHVMWSRVPELWTFGKNMWRERINSLTAKAEFSAPVTAASIAIAEQAIGVRLPADLVAVLNESDGISGEYGLGLLWKIERIKEENRRFRSIPDFKDLYMPFDSLLFFGDAGNGDQFAYTVLQGEVRRDDIFVWDHENDSRTWVAPSLGVFYDWWLTGKLKI
jgi:hypothetical protein